jgi:membrane-associated phospholipid phosphatase
MPVTARLPTQFDIHSAAVLAGFLGRHPLFDHCVESAIQHHLLGGIPFAACLFYFWVQAERENREDALRRSITILLGSLVAIALALFAGKTASWLPPQRQPGLAHLYPAYLLPDINTNSFPSDSTALFTSIAMGILSLNRAAGVMLLLAVPFLISLPRMYVGGHYPTDVLAGFLIGVAGYAIGRLALERPVSARILAIGHRPGWRGVLLETCVFLWILEVAVNFREGVWIVNALQYFHMRFPG